jgi:hypothetical protein
VLFQSSLDRYSIPLVQIDIGLLADQVGVTSSDTLDSGKRVHDLLFALDVGVKETQDLLHVSLLFQDILSMLLGYGDIAGTSIETIRVGRN